GGGAEAAGEAARGPPPDGRGTAGRAGAPGEDARRGQVRWRGGAWCVVGGGWCVVRGEIGSSNRGWVRQAAPSPWPHPSSAEATDWTTHHAPRTTHHAAER